MLTAEDILTSSGKYPEREKSAECTAQVRRNALELAAKVSALFALLRKTCPPVSSGFRTISANAALPNSAKKSHHMTGDAVDIEDPSGNLKALLMASLDVLEHIGLYMESPASTPTWCHLQQVPPGSGHRVFNP